MAEIRCWTDMVGQQWACGAPDHGPFCRLCQPVDEVLDGLLANVDAGYMEWSIYPNGEFVFKMTDAGNQAAGDLITTLEMEDRVDE